MLKFRSLFDLLNSNPTEEDCIRYFEEIRWKGKPVSPFDPTSKVYKLTDGKYKCKNTNRRFTVITKSIFSSTKLPLKKWFQALATYSSHKKGISSHQLARDIGITQGSAWYLLQRLRYASNIPLFKEMLKGSVEVDEAFVGGKNKNRHWNKKIPYSQGRSWKDKIVIWGGIEKGGNLICQVVPDTKQNTLVSIIKANVEKGSVLNSDEWYRHSNLYKDFNHQMVNHRIKQYVNGETTTNRIENPWSHLKRTIYGTYIHISRKHSQRYMDEFTFRFNTRKYNEQERFDLLLLSTVGKHLTYRKLVSTF